MTSPAIGKSPEKQKSASKSPSHTSENGVQRETQDSAAVTSSQPDASRDPLSWLRIFKLADLMMKQGC
ncbi:unnamed protein product [Leptidea sinapis]|uniref:Uncharacterized protein n=1 Tax=Leptidea sinapis TaxID=189913 RepID=A0A5E4QT51_9NEOP|nr:unnamed protein product [Leptidea sinapis]